jgi:1-acyl-sn-glycerol-3-phosphate acyltransferase
VSWAVLSYRTPAGAPPADTSVCWWGDMPFAAHVWGMMRLPRIEARLEFGPGTVTETDRKELAERLHHEVRSRLRASGAR